MATVGSVVGLVGAVALVVAVVALYRGRLVWARIYSRWSAGVVLAVASLLVVVGGALNQEAEGRPVPSPSVSPSTSTQPPSHQPSSSVSSTAEAGQSVTSAHVPLATSAHGPQSCVENPEQGGCQIVGPPADPYVESTVTVPPGVCQGSREWCYGETGPTTSTYTPTPTVGVYYSSCEAAREAGVTPLHVGDLGYRSGLDADGDGIACEK